MLLGDEYEAFSEALGAPAVRAIRLNPLKYRGTSIEEELGYALRKIPYTEGGYIIDDDSDGVGNSPYHHGGAFYVQDPGAMATVEAVDVSPGDWVADLCAAPGGKSTQVAAKLGEGGFLLSNEFVPKRAKILVGNLERMGVRNAIVTSLDTGRLAELFDGVFDLVIADAPCSGEGMFRKGDAAKDNWSEENVRACAERQKYILDNAAGMVRDGGRLVYSTCTYSLEENEMAVDAFLLRHPEFELIPATQRVIAATSDGFTFPGAISDKLSYTRRFYPHRSEGEGQFIAVLKKKDGDHSGRFLYKDAIKAPTKADMAIVEDFFRKNLTSRPKGRVGLYNSNLVLLAHDHPVPEGSVFCAGVLIGEVRSGILFPSHQLFSAYGGDFRLREELSLADAKKYLLGEEIAASTLSGASGYCAVSYGGVTLGGGKVSQGRIKNHYPKGLRLKK